MAGSSGYWENPYPEYEELRREGSVHWNDDIETWIITGYPEARAALANDQMSSQWLCGPLYASLHAPVVEHVRDWLMWMDPPDHKVLRTELAALFTARALDAQARDIDTWTASAYANFVRSGGGDVVGDLAVPLVTRIVAKIAGLESVSQTILQDWSKAAGTLMASLHRPQSVAAAGHALARLDGAVTGSSAGQQTVVGRSRVLGNRSPGGSPLHLASLFAFAGIETTSQALARLVDLYAAGMIGRDRPADRIVDELLRYDTPVHQVPRVAARRTRVSGHTVEEGQLLLVVLAAANRDSRTFGEPALVSPRNDAARHMAYGHGRHRCIGAPLANLILGSVARQLSLHPMPRSASSPDWHRDRGYRGIARLVVGYDQTQAR